MSAISHCIMWDRPADAIIEEAKREGVNLCAK